MRLLVIEASTSSLKLVIRDTQTNEQIEQIEKYENGLSMHGRQDILEIEKQLYRMIIELTSGIDIDAISFVATWHNLLILDQDYHPIAYSYTWEDVSANHITKSLKQDPRFVDTYYKKTGCVVHAMYPYFKLLSIKDKLKSNMKVCNQVTYLYYKFIGKFIETSSLLSGSGYLNITTLDYDDDLLNDLNLTKDNFPQISKDTASFPLRSDIALKLNLRKGIPIVCPNADGALNQLAETEKQKDIMSFSVGTSGALRIAQKAPFFSENQTTWCYRMPSSWIVGAATSGACNIVDWYKEKFFPKTSFEKLEKKLKWNESTPIFMPFLFGERSPGWMDSATAQFHEIKVEHDAIDLYCSILEGVLFNLYQCYQEIVNVSEKKPSKIVISGGITKSNKWLQLCADIFNEKLYVSIQKDASIQGSISHALQILEVDDCVYNSSYLGQKVVYPHKEVHSIEKFRYQKYLAYYELLKTSQKPY